MMESGGREGPFLPRILPHGEGLFGHTAQSVKIFGSGRILGLQSDGRRSNFRYRCRTYSAARLQGSRMPSAASAALS
jgi:hypothetical protein